MFEYLFFLTIALSILVAARKIRIRRAMQQRVEREDWK